jgi:hypothetical protein
MNNLVELYCVVDDCCQKFMSEFEKCLLEELPKQRYKPCSLSQSEIMTLIIYFHQLRFLDFKTYYTQYVQKHLQAEFPKLVSYNRFVELMPSVLLPFCLFIHCQERQIIHGLVFWL